jgi:hypothetical protein
MAENKNKKHRNTPPAKKNIAPVKKDQQQTGVKKTTAKKSYIHIFTACLIAICGMLLYSNTARHSYVLDDFSVIADNRITKGGSDSVTTIFKTGYRDGNFTAQDKLYRPFTKAMFAVEYEQSGGKPGLMHVINIISYGLLCGFVFLLLMRLLPGQYYLVLITSLLFTFHPIHTEVVANIKSRDEIMALFFLALSLWFAKSYADSLKVKWIIPTALFYFLALLTKESAITYVALLPLTLYFFSKIPLKKNGLITFCMVMITGIYLYIHQSVIGSIGLSSIPVPDNSLMESKSFLVQRMTAIEILGHYLRLLVFPHPLSSDYSFKTIPLVTSAGNIGFLLALILHAGALVYAIINLKKKTIASYAILFYLITISIVSNIFLLIGTNMAERLVFIPSLGFCLLVAFLLVKLLKLEKINPENIPAVFTKKAVLWVVLLPLLVLAGIKTHNRNKDWRTISTLFNHDLKTVPNSVHMLYYHAGMITNADSLSIQTDEQRMKTLKLAEKEMLKAVELYEPFLDGHALLGKIYQRLGDYDNGIKHYKRFLQQNDKNPVVYNNYGTCFGFKGDLKNAEINFQKAVDISPICYGDALCNLGAIYIFYGQQYMAENKPAEATQAFKKSIDFLNQTIACDAQNSQAYQYMGACYNALGDTANGSMYTKKGVEMAEMKRQRLLKSK